MQQKHKVQIGAGVKTNGSGKNPTEKGKTGALGETLAAKFLESKGYKVLKRNYRKPWGEIDIICEKGNTIRFVEVKTVSHEIDIVSVSREPSTFSGSSGVKPPDSNVSTRHTNSDSAKKVLGENMDYRPEELVDARKLKKLARTAALYMEVSRDTREYQIDVVGVILDKKAKIARCRLFEQALEDNL